LKISQNDTWYIGRRC